MLIHLPFLTALLLILFIYFNANKFFLLLSADLHCLLSPASVLGFCYLKHNDMAGTHEISIHIQSNGINLFFISITVFSAHGKSLYYLKVDLM